MLKKEIKTKGSPYLWEEEKLWGKRERSPRKLHKERQQLRTLVQLYGRDSGALCHLEDVLE